MARDRRKSTDSLLRIWANISRQQSQTVDPSNIITGYTGTGAWVQVGRNALPLFDAGLVGTQRQTQYLHTTPMNDVTNFGNDILYPALVRDADALGIYKALHVPASAVATLKGPGWTLSTRSTWAAIPVADGSPVTSSPWTRRSIQVPQRTAHGRRHPLPTSHTPRVVRRCGHGGRGSSQDGSSFDPLRDVLMSDEKIRQVLAGQKALVVGVANDQSIAYGCAKAFRTVGAELAITWLNERARPYVEPLAQELGAPITGALDVSVPGQLEAIFHRIRAEWGKIDILVHSIAFAPKEDLQGGLLNCSAEGFAKAMDISCHSFVRMAKLAAPLMPDGGSMFAMSYYGANRVVANYNVMGPVKAALEAACRYLAYELGPQGIRVHAISPGPLKTRAASGLKDFELLLNEAAEKAPLGELVDIMDVGFACAYLATSLARRVTGGTVYVDGGANIVA